MVRGFGDVASVSFLPEDRAATDRALVAGRSVVELGEGPLAAAVAGLALEGVFLERTARRQVMTVLPESEPAARQPLSESVT